MIYKLLSALKFVWYIVAEVQNVLSQKNPISSFMEYGQARRMVPEIVEVDTDGPDHCRK